MGKVFYISDLHFGHKNCLVFDNRPFPDIEKHDNCIIENWNNAVGYDDEVYILGDISFYNATKTLEIFSQLNGIKHLIKGNHDNKLLKNRGIQSLFCEITDYKEIRPDGNNNVGIVLSHYPILCFNHCLNGWIHLYGHVHNSTEYNIVSRFRYEMENLDKRCFMFNVGVMMPYMEYTPKTLEEIVSTAV